MSQQQTYAILEIFTFPLQHRVRLEVVEIIKVESLVLAVKLSSPFFSFLDDGIDVLVYLEPAVKVSAAHNYHSAELNVLVC